MGKSFDYIIAGAGASGLSLLYYLLQREETKHKSILIIDKDSKKSNDRTWCFWEIGEGPYESILTKKWKELSFASEQSTFDLDIFPYQYKMIQSTEFYQFGFELIDAHDNVQFLQDEITELSDSAVHTTQGIFSAQYIFNSATYYIDKSNAHYLDQHFKGWYIQTDKQVFNPEKAMLMDFSIVQENGCDFVYVLPTSSTEALVEYTVFSPEILDEEKYDKYLEKYMADRFPNVQYEIVEQEFGVIPMTNAKMNRKQDNIINIGTAGGYSKPSTGYTFTFIQKYTSRIADNLAKGIAPLKGIEKPAAKYDFYDSIFLRVLSEKKMHSRDVFRLLFENVSAKDVLDFLGEESTLAQDLKIMWALPKGKFMSAALREYT